MNRILIAVALALALAAWPPPAAGQDWNCMIRLAAEGDLFAALRALRDDLAAARAEIAAPALQPEDRKRLAARIDRHLRLADRFLACARAAAP
jgi:hypothetical protein